MSSSVSLVIPGRNCERTIDRCLSAVVAIQESYPDVLREILFVDDGSVDRTCELVEGHPVTLIPGSGQGPGAARNLGWRVATSSLVWFVDSDCVAHPEALETLLPHFDDSSVGAVSGTYGNASEDSLLGCLIHEEIVERHHRMGREVDFLATFNVIYRRTILEEKASMSATSRPKMPNCRSEPERPAIYFTSKWSRLSTITTSSVCVRISRPKDSRAIGGSGCILSTQATLPRIPTAVLSIISSPWSPWACWVPLFCGSCRSVGRSRCFWSSFCWPCKSP